MQCNSAFDKRSLTIYGRLGDTFVKTIINNNISVQTQIISRRLQITGGCHSDFNSKQKSMIYCNDPQFCVVFAIYTYQVLTH
jgi:hypothetical protein